MVSLQIKLREQRAVVRRGDRNNGIAVHAWDNDHRVDWDRAKVIAQESYYWKRRTLEAIHIEVWMHHESRLWPLYEPSMAPLLFTVILPLLLSFCYY